MRQDEYGQFIYTERDIIELYMQDPGRNIKHCMTSGIIKIDPELDLQDVPDLIHYVHPGERVEAFDDRSQKNWHMPDSYKNLDIAQWLLDQCGTDEQQQRVAQELLMYMERDMFPVLLYLKYLVDIMRLNNIVWGVGRGSSVASYVLYLIGVHKIDSLYFGLDINEFLR
jgi:DNA polymerase III alpha subunit